MAARAAAVEVQRAPVQRPPAERVRVVQEEPLLSPREKLFFKTISQLVIRTLFPLVTTLMLAPLFPVAFSAVLITTTALGTALLSGFFFQPEVFARGFYPAALRVNQPAVPAEPLPEGAPKGLSNLSQNCWANSVLQLFRSSRMMMDWFGEIENEDLDLQARDLFPIRQFYEGYDEPSVPGRNIARASSQTIRVLLSRLLRLDPMQPLSQDNPSAISPNARRQEDAAEAMTPILDRLPNALKVELTEATTYDTTGLPAIVPGEADVRAGVEIQDGVKKVKRELRSPFFQLALKEPNPHLFRMLDYYFNEDVSDNDGKVNCLGEDGIVRRYQRTKVETRFVNAPESLFIQLKRFEFRRGPSSLITRICSCIWQVFGYNIRKNNTDVDVPLEVPIQPTNGPLRNYQLKGMVLHQGGSAQSGHYKAYVIDEEGVGYCCNDSSVTRVDREDWPVGQAYVLHYELIPNMVVI